MASSYKKNLYTRKRRELKARLQHLEKDNKSFWTHGVIAPVSLPMEKTARAIENALQTDAFRKASQSMGIVGAGVGFFAGLTAALSAPAVLQSLTWGVGTFLGTAVTGAVLPAVAVITTSALLATATQVPEGLKRAVNPDNWYVNKVNGREKEIERTCNDLDQLEQQEKHEQYIENLMKDEDFEDEFHPSQSIATKVDMLSSFERQGSKKNQHNDTINLGATDRISSNPSPNPEFSSNRAGRKLRR